MKNIIISILMAYSYYGICEIKSVPVTIVMGLVVFAVCIDIDEHSKDWKRYIRGLKEEICEK